MAGDLFDGVHNRVRDPATSEWMRWRYSTHLFASLGELWLARKDSAKAGEFIEQSLDIAKRTNSRKYLAKGWRLKGEISIMRKQWDEAEDALRQALTVAKTIGNPSQLWKTYITMGRLHDKVKQSEMAEKAYEAAREVINKIKANLQDSELRASFERYPVISQIFA